MYILLFVPTYSILFVLYILWSIYLFNFLICSLCSKCIGEDGQSSMLTYGAIIGTGFVMGVVHVLSGPDHLSALATLAVGNSCKAFWLGVRWGMGHSTGLILIAILFICMDDRIDLEEISKYCNWIVGVFMIALGLYGMYTCRKKYYEKIRKERISQLHDGVDEDVFRKEEEEFGNVELSTLKSSGTSSSSSSHNHSNKKKKKKKNNNNDNINNNNNDSSISRTEERGKDESESESESESRNANGNDDGDNNIKIVVMKKTKTATRKIKGQTWPSQSQSEDEDEDQEGENQPLTPAGHGKGGSVFSSSFSPNWFQFRNLLPGSSSHGTNFSSVPFQSPEHSPKPSNDDADSSLPIHHPTTNQKKTIKMTTANHDKQRIQEEIIEKNGNLQDDDNHFESSTASYALKREDQMIQSKEGSSEDEVIVNLSVFPIEDGKVEDNTIFNNNDGENSPSDTKITLNTTTDSSMLMASSSTSPSSAANSKKSTAWRDKLHMENPIMQRIVAFGIGIVHGIAGPGGILGVIPAVEYNNWAKSILYLGTFCITSTLIMGIFAAIYGEITSKMASTTLIEYRLGIFSAFLSVAVGVTWIALVAIHKLDEVFE